MVNFQKGTLIIASIILVITLSFVAISFGNIKNDSKYPPVVSDCPDYWISKSDTTENICVNPHKNLGNSDCSKTVDFSQVRWLGEIGACNKRTWAKSCNLTWDGVTNSNKNTCNRQYD
jgi:hypothetical protein